MPSLSKKKGASSSHRGVPRAKTAIRRTSCSRPIAHALADGLITKETVCFDFGCGHGADVRYLRARQIKATGWDPAHRPNNKLVSSSVVNLGYVLNVIEDPKERAATLLRAFNLAKQLLIVSVRLDKSIGESDEFGDGVLTTRGTFQKIYTQKEFQDYTEQVLESNVHVASLGIVYVFKDVNLEAQYLARRAFTHRLEYRTDLIEEFGKHKVAKAFVKLANQLGRVPIHKEFSKYSELLEHFGSPQRIERLTLQHINKDRFEGSRHEQRDDIFTFLAMLRLENIQAPQFSKLPITIQKDIKAIWGNYKNAIAEAMAFLFSLGERKNIVTACKNASVGKMLQDDFYVHRSAEDDLPALLRVLIFAAQRIVGDLSYDLVKLTLDGRRVSFLFYPDFDTDPHPALQKSVKVYLPKADYRILEYKTSPNPPILHRKEAFVSASYPYYEKFKRLTVEEEALGLLSRSDIGSWLGWKEILDSKGVTIQDHQIVKLK